MFPSPELIDFWLEQAGLERAGSLCGVPLARRGRRLVNAGGRDFPLLLPPTDTAGRGEAAAPAGADLLVVHDLPADSPARARLEARLPGGRFLPTYPCAVAELGPEPAEFPHRRLSSRKRRGFARLRRKLGALGRVELVEIGAGEADRFLPRFFELVEERAAWHRTLDRNLRRRDYLAGLWRRFAGGELLVSALTLDGVPISYRSGFIVGETFVGYQPVADLAFARFSLGHLHLIEMLQTFAQRRLTVYDFSKGIEPNKELWATRRYQLGDFVAPLAAGPGARLRFAVARARAALRDRLYTPSRLRTLRRLRFAAACLARPGLARTARRVRAGGEPLAAGAGGTAPAERFRYGAIETLPLALRRTVLDQAYRLARPGERLDLGSAPGLVVLSAPRRKERLAWRYDAS